MTTRRKPQVKYICPKCGGEATGHLVLPRAVIYFFHERDAVCHVRAKAVRGAKGYTFSRILRHTRARRSSA